MIPGELFPAEGEITINAGRDAVEMEVANTGDRPIQVGSHYHFAAPRTGGVWTSPPAPPCGSSRGRRGGCG